MENGVMKFMHLADVHLGASPDGRAAWSQGRQEEIWETSKEILARLAAVQ